MNLEIFQKGTKFFIRDTDSGQVQGKAGGYASRVEAQAAIKTLSASADLAKAPMPDMAMPKAPVPAPMGGPGGMPTPGAPSPAALANLLRSKRSAA